MTNEFLHFEKISRQTWQSLHRKTTPPLTEEELESIKSFNDQISLQDVTDVYLPLAHLIQIYKRTKDDLAFSKGIFLQRESKSQPFIIGVSGSVAVENLQPAAYFKSYYPVPLQMLQLSW